MSTTANKKVVQIVKKVKSFPNHMGPWGGADLRFL